jgi:hypothetical protein
MEKVMSLKHLYTKRYHGKRWGSATNLDVFGRKGKLPPCDIQGNKKITFDDGTTVWLYLLPGTPRKRKHRVYVICEKCQCYVPTGRVHQHVCKEI